MEKEKKVKSNNSNKDNKSNKTKKKSVTVSKEKKKVESKVVKKEINVDKKTTIKKEKKISNKFNKKRNLIIILSLVIIIVLSIVFYLSDYYRMDLELIEAFMKDSTVPEKILSDGTIIYGNENNEIGLIFYQGGKVEYTSYKPLLEDVASKGVTTVLVKSPFNLAIMDVDAANDVKEKLPNIKKWYIAGHSLGGATASYHVCSHQGEYEGLVLLGAYVSCDLSQSDIKVMSIYGSEDKVLSKETYDENLKNVPKDFSEFKIDGGNHAQFGMYGKQSGDGEATISNVEQITITSNEIYAFMTE